MAAPITPSTAAGAPAGAKAIPFTRVAVALVVCDDKAFRDWAITCSLSAEPVGGGLAEPFVPAEAAGIDAAAPTASTEAPVGAVAFESTGAFPARVPSEVGFGAFGTGRARLESTAPIVRVARPTVSPAAWVPAPSASDNAAANTAEAPSNFESCRSG